MKQRSILLTLTIILCFYSLLFPRISGKELILQPEIYRSLTSVQGATSSPDSLAAYSNGQLVGYFDNQNTLTGVYLARDIVYDDQWLVKKNQDGLSLLTPQGNPRAEWKGDLRAVAFPDILYLYDRTIGRLSRVNPENGRTIWSRDFLDPLTVLDTHATRTLVGSINGQVMLLNSQGEAELEYSPGGSQTEGIYGGALSGDGTKIALVSGLNPQRFILLEERKNGFRPVFHFDTNSDFRRSIPVKFISNNQRILFESENSVVAVDTNTLSSIPVLSNGRPLTWIDDPETGLLTILSQSQENRTLTVLTSRDQIIYNNHMPPEIIGLDTSHGQINVSGTGGIGTLKVVIQ